MMSALFWLSFIGVFCVLCSFSVLLYTVFGLDLSPGGQTTDVSRANRFNDVLTGDSEVRRAA